MSDSSDGRKANQEQVTAKRAEYMAREITHGEHYRWLAEFVGVEESLIPFGDASLLRSTDEHLNDLPLAQWDRQDWAVRQLVRPLGIAWSLSDTVCCLKELARGRQARLRAFLSQTGIPADKLAELISLGERCTRANVGYSNGDPHPSYPNASDKNFNAQRWAAVLGDLAAELTKLVAPFGLAVEFNGLAPTLTRGRESFFIPFRSAGDE